MAEVLRDFQCKLCSKLLGSRAALQRHSKEVHSRNSTVVSCPRCQKLFQNRSNLKIHMLTHSGVRPFKYVVEYHISLHNFYSTAELSFFLSFLSLFFAFHCTVQLINIIHTFLDARRLSVTQLSPRSNAYNSITRKCTIIHKNRCRRSSVASRIHLMHIRAA